MSSTAEAGSFGSVVIEGSALVGGSGDVTGVFNGSGAAIDGGSDGGEAGGTVGGNAGGSAPGAGSSFVCFLSSGKNHSSGCTSQSSAGMSAACELLAEASTRAWCKGNWASFPPPLSVSVRDWATGSASPKASPTCKPSPGTVPPSIPCAGCTGTGYRIRGIAGFTAVPATRWAVGRYGGNSSWARCGAFSTVANSTTDAIGQCAYNCASSASAFAAETGRAAADVLASWIRPAAKTPACLDSPDVTTGPQASWQMRPVADNATIASTAPDTRRSELSKPERIG
jgi:hypothetical protein